MRFIDEYRDPKLAEGLLHRIHAAARRIERPITIMEICGSHTHAMGRFGIRSLLPDSLNLISGPGCPVCVTSIEDVDRALYLASLPDVIFATFGDMMKVPGSGGDSLQKKRADGCDIRVISSADECMAIARSNPERDVVLMGIGFETTAPTVAALLKRCRENAEERISVFSVHKVVPPALKGLVQDPLLHIDGFLCPGHVSTIIGTDAYRIIPETGRAAVIAGFEPLDILESLLLLLRQIETGNRTVDVQYSRAVNSEGNRRAMELLRTVFEPADVRWRGLGTIQAGGLVPGREFGGFDAVKKYCLPDIRAVDIPGCSCGDILRGIKSPLDCPLFKNRCTPAHPLGPCMVSSEGTCSSYFKYH